MPWKHLKGRMQKQGKSLLSKRKLIVNFYKLIFKNIYNFLIAINKEINTQIFFTIIIK